MTEECETEASQRTVTSDTAPESQFALCMSGIVKSFPGVLALDHVDLTVGHCQIHALVGENGAGKSTLMKTLGGIIPPDAGEIRLFGKVVQPRSPRHAQRLGISIIHQEFNLIPALSAAENIFFGDLPRGSLPFSVNWRECVRRAELLLSSLGGRFLATTPVRKLRVSERQIVEIARALSYRTRILVMDEPTAAL
ncbi:MAG: ATP-binding cassette domain-containing protein, partial [Firmicutes bacterium]|nr:ATP-binding cassette domain-containing protein [Bacillota bacterium]